MSADLSNLTPRLAKLVYRFGDFELRCESGELFRNGIRVRVQDQSLQVLLALLENPGTVVSRDELRQRLWPNGTYVDFEHSLNAAVKRLRAALADDASDPLYIETLPRRGYRLLVGASSEVPPAAPVVEMQPELVPDPRSRRTLIWAVAVVIAVMVLIAAATLSLRLHRRTNPVLAVNSSTEARLPRDGEANELYLRSLNYKFEFPANAQALQLLERAVAIDPNSARLWFELARRYNCEFYSAARGQAFFQHARDANNRALQLAPDFMAAKVLKVAFDIDSGQVLSGYDAALALVRSNPKDVSAHNVLSYALRVGGMYEESARECETALKLDPSNAMLRSCSLVFILLGRYDRAPTYIDLDTLSYYAHYRRMDLAILRNEKATALEIAQSIRVEHGPTDYADARMLEAVLAGKPPAIVRYWSQQSEALYDKITNPEAHFVDARYQSWAGQTDAAARLLRRAILNGYCSYPAMDSDPLLANLRRLAEYKELRRAGMECNQNFRAHSVEAP